MFTTAKSQISRFIWLGSLQESTPNMTWRRVYCVAGTCEVERVQCYFLRHTHARGSLIVDLRLKRRLKWKCLLS